MHGNFTDGTLTVTDGSTLSETLPFFNGEWTLTLPNKGREIQEYSAQKAFTGARLAGPVAAELAVAGHLGELVDDWQALVTGTAAGFTSVWTSDSDVPFFHGSLDVSNGARSRIITFQYGYIPSFDLAGGGPNSRSQTIRILGSITMTEDDGTVTTLVSGLSR